MLAALALTAQLAVTVSAPDTVYACEPALVTVRVTAPRGASVHLVAPDLAPFGILRVSSGARPDSLRRRNSVTDVYRYTLGTARTGAFTLPAFEARVGERSARSARSRIVVRPSAANPRLPRVVGSTPIAGGDTVTFRALAFPDTVYVGEQLTYQVGAFFEEGIRTRLRRNPEFFPPALHAMLAYELPLPGGAVPRRESGGRCYEAPVYARALFPLSAGHHTLPPARLLYSLSRPYSVWSGEESHERITDSVTIVAVEPPAEGRPATFSGTVGEVAVSARPSARSSRVGEPLVLTARVEGSGNVKLFARPALSLSWASVVPADERVTVEPDPGLVRGAKEFDWIVTPRESGTVVLPSIDYSYFDPVEARYVTASSAPDTLEIAPGSLAAGTTGDRASAQAPALLPLRPRLRAETPAPLSEHPAYWLALMLAPFPALAIGAVRLPRRRRTGVRPPRALRAFSGARANRDPAALRRAFVAALGDRLGIPSSHLADRARFTRTLRRAGVSDAAAESAARFLADLTEAAYSPGAPPLRDAVRRAWQAYHAVDVEAKRARRPPGGATALLLACSLAATGTMLAQSASPAATFGRGIALYEARRFGEAERAFAEVAQRAPRAEDAWANLGTAAWAASDTTAAALGWQRALRLNPLADDVRERLALIPAQRSLLASVPPVPSSLLAGMGVLLWVAGWLGVAARAAWRQPLFRGWSALSGAAGVLLVGSAAVVEQRTQARELSLLAGPASLRALPALGAERIRGLGAAEVLRVVERRGAWARVSMGGEATGWIEASRLVPLAIP